jgi:hypothetical protein
MPLYYLEAGYLFSSGFYGQVTLAQGMRRSIQRSGPTSPSLQNQPTGLEFSQSAILVGGGWAFRIGSDSLLGFQLAGGPANIEGPGGTSGDSVMWAGEVRYDYLIGRQLGLGMRLGYMGGRFSDFNLDHSGFMGRLGLQWHLFPMRDAPVQKGSPEAKSSGQP